MNNSNNQKPLFYENEYLSFILGVFLIGGLIVNPLLWGNVFGLKHAGSGNYYIGLLVPSIMLCFSMLVFYRKNGTSTKLRMILSLLIGIFVASILSAISGKQSYIFQTILGFITLIVCGKVGAKVYTLRNERKQNME